MEIVDYIVMALCFITAFAFGYALTKDKYNQRNIDSKTRTKVHEKASEESER